DLVAVTRDRIRQCGDDPDQPLGPPPGDPVAGWGQDVVVPDAGEGLGNAIAGPGSGADSGSGSATPTDPGPGGADPGAESPTPPPSKPIQPRHRAAWLLVGSAIATATIGAVLAYSANAAERDIDDLYVGLGGN